MRILLVDDDAMAGEMIAAVLEMAGHAVVLAASAIDAGERLGQDNGFDMIVSDMNMPLVSGVELFRMLRDDGCGLPFVLLTGDAPAALLLQEPRLDGCLTKDAGLVETLSATLVATHERCRASAFADRAEVR